MMRAIVSGVVETLSAAQVDVYLAAPMSHVEAGGWRELYDPDFEMGTTLGAASRPVSLNHPFCASFCVLGGASCSR
jgi:hypothetical protein